MIKWLKDHIFSVDDYEALVSNLSWLGPRCMDLDDWNSPAEAEDHVARWRKTMNLSISCFITALIIITAAIMLVRSKINLLRNTIISPRHIQK